MSTKLSEATLSTTISSKRANRWRAIESRQTGSGAARFHVTIPMETRGEDIGRELLYQVWEDAEDADEVAVIALGTIAMVNGSRILCLIAWK